MKENDGETEEEEQQEKMGLNKNAGGIKKNTGEKNKSGWRMVQSVRHGGAKTNAFA